MNSGQNLSGIVSEAHYRWEGVTFCWVPGPAGISGNEYAVVLANKVSMVKLIRPDPYCRISKKLAMQVIAPFKQISSDFLS